MDHGKSKINTKNMVSKFFKFQFERRGSISSKYRDRIFQKLSQKLEKRIQHHSNIILKILKK